jgi:hypothetical protein
LVFVSRAIGVDVSDADAPLSPLAMGKNAELSQLKEQVIHLMFRLQNVRRFSIRVAVNITIKLTVLRATTRTFLPS